MFTYPLVKNKGHMPEAAFCWRLFVPELLEWTEKNYFLASEKLKLQVNHPFIFDWIGSTIWHNYATTTGDFRPLLVAAAWPEKANDWAYEQMMLHVEIIANQIFTQYAHRYRELCKFSPKMLFDPNFEKKFLKWKKLCIEKLVADLKKRETTAFPYDTGGNATFEEFWKEL